MPLKAKVFFEKTCQYLNQKK